MPTVTELQISKTVCYRTHIHLTILVVHITCVPEPSLPMVVSSYPDSTGLRHPHRFIGTWLCMHIERFILSE